MVRLSKILVILLLAQGLWCRSKCSNQNPFLSQMVKENKIAGLDDPVKDSNHCGLEWRKFGSCCSLESAKLYADTDLGLLKNATGLVVAAVTSQVTLMHGLLPKMRLWRDSDKALAANPYANRTLEEQEISLQNLTNLTSSDHEKCWVEEIGKLRSASLCSTCSSRSTSFFFSGKALVSYPTCEKMLAACFPSINHIVKTIDITYKFYRMVDTFRKFDTMKVNLSREVRSLGKHFIEIKSSVSKSLQKYSVSPQNSRERQEASKTLCQQFLQLHGNPFIIKVMKLAVDVTQALVALNTAVNDVKFKVQNIKLGLANKLQSIQGSILDTATKDKAIAQAHRQFKKDKAVHVEQKAKANERVKAKVEKQQKIMKNVVNNYQQAFKPKPNKTQHSRRLNFDSKSVPYNMFGLDTEILVLSDYRRPTIKKIFDRADKQVTKSSYFGIPMNLTLAFP